MHWPDRVNVQEPTTRSPAELITDWVEHVDEPGDYGVLPNQYAAELQEQWGTIWGESRRQLRYLLDRVPPDTTVELDLSEPIHRGSVPVSDTYAIDARNRLADEAVGSMPTIVLTEGSFDADVLEAAMELLRPGLIGFLTFMDYGVRPSGGVGSVANGMKAFAAEGVANRVIGLFDNDSAGAEGQRGLRDVKLPAHIRALSLPPLGFAEAYPTLGPTGPETLDVNGKAVSIEFFLGRDVLARPSGEFEAVQWTQYIKSLDQYQGELLGKREIQERFRTKVKQARAGQLVMEEWTELAYLLDTIADS